MLAFFKHKKFWLPLIALFVFFLSTEFLLKFGVYDQWVKPKSFIGNALFRVKKIEENGLNKIDWIMTGSSRVDWGVNHKKIQETFSLHGLGYGRMSFESSKFTAIQATIDWSIQNLSSMDGIILGVTETELSRFNLLIKQYKVAWPFRNFIDYKNYQSVSPKHEWTKFFYGLAWPNYFLDIKAFLQNPIRRLKEIENNKNRDVLIETRKNKKNLCEIPLKTLNQCVEFARQNEVIPENQAGYYVPRTVCSKPENVKRAKNNVQMSETKNYGQLVKNWSNLINFVLKNDKKFILLLLPEHETHNYIIKPSNATSITQSIVDNFSNNNQFKMIDLRTVLKDKEDCLFFSDPLHLNNKGIELVTTEFIKSLNTLNLD